jgi:hypothetical protein
LYAHAELVPHATNEFDKILLLLESYLVRRMVCNLTGKNYNRYFLDLIRQIDRQGVINAAEVRELMAKSSAESVRYPDDVSFRSAITDLPLYGRLAQYKVRAILEALDLHAYSRKSEPMPMPTGLTIEHVMPQSWQTHWPLAEDKGVMLLEPDPLAELKASKRRDQLVNTLGNLTLVTGSLNPSLSNSGWEKKRPELKKFAKLNLNQYFHGIEADKWDEHAIERRTAVLLDQLTAIWPDLPQGRPS